jgi:hypothetical protein
MAADDDRNRALARQSRTVAIVLIAAVVLWLAGQAAGAALGLAPRFVFLFDFAALAAFLWAFIVTFQIWRKRRNNQG